MKEGRNSSSVKPCLRKALKKRMTHLDTRDKRAQDIAPSAQRSRSVKRVAPSVHSSKGALQAAQQQLSNMIAGCHAEAVKP